MRKRKEWDHFNEIYPWRVIWHDEFTDRIIDISFEGKMTFDRYLSNYEFFHFELISISIPEGENSYKYDSKYNNRIAMPNTIYEVCFNAVDKAHSHYKPWNKIIRDRFFTEMGARCAAYKYKNDYTATYKNVEVYAVDLQKEGRTKLPEIDSYSIIKDPHFGHFKDIEEVYGFKYEQLIYPKDFWRLHELV